MSHLMSAYNSLHTLVESVVAFSRKYDVYMSVNILLS